MLRPLSYSGITVKGHDAHLKYGIPGVIFREAGPVRHPEFSQYCQTGSMS
jgi:hypothetical protein